LFNANTIFAADGLAFTYTYRVLQEVRRHGSSKDSSLVKLPPSEAAFRQHILRVAFQVYAWTHANEAKPPPRSPLEYGWRNVLFSFRYLL
jgi:hypothetical protein